MHPNEIKIDQNNVETLTQEAEKLGPNYVAALKEQSERQKEK